MSSSERVGEATARPLLWALCLRLWAVGRTMWTLCWLFVVALFVGGTLKRLLFPGPNEPSRDLVLLLVVWTVLALLWFRVRALAFGTSGSVGGRMGFFSEFMHGFREARAEGRDPPKQDGPFQNARSDAHSSDNEAGLLRQIRELKAALARAAEENASLRAQLARAAEENASLRAELARGNDKQGMDQLARAQIRQLESILAFPGVRKALVKVLHPDTGEGGSNDTRKEMFQTLMAVMDRMGVRG